MLEYRYYLLFLLLSFSLLLLKEGVQVVNLLHKLLKDFIFEFSSDAYFFVEVVLEGRDLFVYDEFEVWVRLYRVLDALFDLMLDLFNVGVETAH